MDVVENEERLWQSSCCAAGELNQPFCTCHPVCQVHFFPPCAGPVTSPPAKLLHGSCIQRMSSEPKSTVYFFRLKVQKAFTALVGDWLHVLKVLSFGTWCFDSFFFLAIKSLHHLLYCPSDLMLTSSPQTWRSAGSRHLEDTWRCPAQIVFHFIFQLQFLSWSLIIRLNKLCSSSPWFVSASTAYCKTYIYIDSIFIYATTVFIDNVHQ